MMTKPSCLKIIPASPERNIKGTNTTTVVMLEAVIAIPISEAPVMAAFSGLNPLSRYLTIFSSTTIPLSTTMPDAMASDISDTRLMVYLPIYRKINAMIKEKGMVRAMMMEALNLLKKIIVTRTTKNIPHNNDALKFFMEVLMFSALSVVILICTSEGSVLLISASFAFILSITSTVFFPACFCKIRMMPFFPSPQPFISRGL